MLDLLLIPKNLSPNQSTHVDMFVSRMKLLKKMHCTITMGRISLRPTRGGRFRLRMERESRGGVRDSRGGFTRESKGRESFDPFGGQRSSMPREKDSMGADGVGLFYALYLTVDDRI